MVDFPFALKGCSELLMVAKGSKPRGPANPSVRDGLSSIGTLGTVRLQKPTPKVATPGLREKICSSCGTTFKLTPDQKFFLCPECYTREHRRNNRAHSTGTQVLTQITCMECGAKEYLGFVPQEPSQTLCTACFGRRKREQIPNTNHPFSR